VEVGCDIIAMHDMHIKSGLSAMSHTETGCVTLLALVFLRRTPPLAFMN